MTSYAFPTANKILGFKGYKWLGERICIKCASLYDPNRVSTEQRV